MTIGRAVCGVVQMCDAMDGATHVRTRRAGPLSTPLRYLSLMPLATLLYRAATRSAAAVLPAIAPWVGGKLAVGTRGRRGVVARIEAWAAQRRDPDRPLLWIHAPSVGEGLQAEVVLREVRRRHPDWQVVYTHFSPSAVALAARQGADVTDYLPWDTPDAARRVLEALRPDALVFAKADLWPELACQAASRGTRIGIIAATVSPVSRRLRWPARTLMRRGYRVVTAAGAIAAEDAERLTALGTPADRIDILGDPRFDSVRSVIEAVPPNDPALRFRGTGLALVAGSTWPADETRVLKAFTEVLRVHPEARLILAPHEPTPRHLVAVRAEARRHELPEPRLIADAGAEDPLVLVDRVGLLARLYGSAGLAYVGGGFGSAGLHSVLEPAGWGVPVAFGPRSANSREAELLVEAGAALRLDHPDPARQLATWWSRMLGERAERETAGRAAFAVLDAGRGSAARQADLVERLVGAQRRSTTIPS